MSSHQNSVGESALNLISPPLSRSNYGARATRPHPRPIVRTHAPDAIWGQYNNYRANGVVVSAIIPVSYTHLTLPTILRV